MKITQEELEHKLAVVGFVAIAGGILLGYIFSPLITRVIGTDFTHSHDNSHQHDSVEHNHVH